MLSNEDKQIIKAKLLAEISQAEASINKLKEQTKPVSPDSSIGRLTRMDAIQQKSLAESMLRDAHQTLHGLTEAMKIIESAFFGICILCKKPIALERILAIPHVKKCIHCA